MDADVIMYMQAFMYMHSLTGARGHISERRAATPMPAAAV